MEILDDNQILLNILKASSILRINRIDVNETMLRDLRQGNFHKISSFLKNSIVLKNINEYFSEFLVNIEFNNPFLKGNKTVIIFTIPRTVKYYDYENKKLNFLYHNNYPEDYSPNREKMGHKSLKYIEWENENKVEEDEEDSDENIKLFDYIDIYCQELNFLFQKFKIDLRSKGFHFIYDCYKNGKNSFVVEFEVF